MRLRTKFALVLSGCSLLFFLVTTTVLARFFASEQKAYLNDFQSSLALFSKRQMEMRMFLLHSQLASLIDADSIRYDEVLRHIAGALGGELWDGKRRLFSSRRESGRAVPPPAGKSAWALISSPSNPNTPSVRWIGRFNSKTAVIDFKAEWLAEAFESTHGAVSRLVLADSAVLFASSSARAPILGPEYFHSPELLTRMFNRDVGTPETVQYRSVDGASFVGTFLPMDVEPPLMVVISTPWSAIQAVVNRTYEKSTWIAGICLVLAVLIGAAFSSTLTAPLQALMAQTQEIAKGRFTASGLAASWRKDEVGVLARSFERMTLELDKLRTELRRSERLAALGKFSASVAHEIKNPLANILANAQVAELKLNSDGDLDKAGLQQALKYAKDETWRASHIVMRLMKFARQEKPPTNRIDLAETLRNLIAIARPAVEQAGVELEAAFPGTLVHCVADEDQLQEVISNIIQNAVHAVRNSNEKRINLKLESEDGIARIRIRDTGHGMSAEVKEHLFEPFFTTKGIGEGTGLGLAVCHGIITTHRGRIDVESEEGKGTEVILTLPLAEATGQRLLAA